MQKVYIINKMDITPFGPDTPEIIGITLNPDNVLEIINGYMHYRVEDTEEYAGQHEVELERKTLNKLWRRYRDCNFESMNVGSGMFYSGDLYGIEVTVHELYESSDEIKDKESDYDGKLSDVSLPL